VRLSITTVEAFRLWRDTGDWMALEELEAQIRRDGPPNEKMLRGGAFHSVIENPTACRETSLEGTQYRVKSRDDGRDFVFAGEGMEKFLRIWPTGCAAEIKNTFAIDGINVVGMPDALRGVEVWEAKCTEKIDVEKYFDSFQWKALLRLYNATVARYVLAQGKDMGGRYVVIYDVLPLPLYRYPRLNDDVRRLTLECADFIVQRNLESYVQDKIEEAA
jgi:hypothetical protein